MDDQTSDEFVSCTDCGSPLDPGLERDYGREDWALCWGCAKKRGGSYDEDEDFWIVEPRIDDLLGRERDFR